MQVALEMSQWIRLKIPKIDDGNNYGIKIQQMVLTDIDQFKNLLLQIERYQDGYIADRMGILNKVYTGSNKRDNKRYMDHVIRTLEVIDIDHFHQFETHILEIELELEFIFDKCKKNVEKLMNPKSNDALNTMF